MQIQAMSGGLRLICHIESSRILLRFDVAPHHSILVDDVDGKVASTVIISSTAYARAQPCRMSVTTTTLAGPGPSAKLRVNGVRTKTGDGGGLGLEQTAGCRVHVAVNVSSAADRNRAAASRRRAYSTGALALDEVRETFSDDVLRAMRPRMCRCMTIAASACCCRSSSS